MRIGFLSDILVTDPWSGMGNYARYLVREWSREHEVWSLSGKSGDPEEKFAGRIRTAWWNPGWRRQIESHTDLVHCPIAQAPDYFYRLDKPRVATIHGAGAFVFLGTEITAAPSAAKLRLREEQGAVDLFLTVSRSAQKEIEEHYQMAAGRIVPIYHGVDPEIFFPAPDKEEARTRAGARHGIPGPYLLHISNYRPKKNGVRIVAAYRRLVERGFKDLALVLAGGTYRGFEEVAAEMARKGDGKIVRIGQLRGQELAALYQGAEVFLFPSLHESFGLPALESMACGVPVVVSNVFSLPEITAGAGVAVNPESVEEIAAATAKLLRDEAFYTECRRRGLARSGHFRWEVCAREHLKAFERAIELFARRKKKKA